MIKKIVVASQNPVKIQAVLNGFQRMFPDQTYGIQGVSAPSEVPDQPDDNEITLRGAQNRARYVMRLHPEADYWVGVEGGVETHAEDMAAYAWIVILSPAQTGRSRTGAFYLPPAVAELVRQGIELGKADDIVFGRTNSKQASGAIGLLTGDVIDRRGLYEHAVILALVAFKNPDLYPAARD